MHEGKHGILDGVEDMDDVFGTKDDHHDHDHHEDHHGHDHGHGDHHHRHFSGTVEAACGMCQFGMKDRKKCELAVRIDGKPYLVEGKASLEHTDAHGADGMCNVIRQAVVEGVIEGDKFIASRFALLPFKK